MSYWQEIVVALLLLGSLVYAGYKLYLFFRGIRKNDNPCENCVSGCELRDMMDKRRKECGEKAKKEKKKCAK
ncbi:MAG: hypothetical protein EOM31_07205 [Bacteroidia bacterium]|nr:hypothetical protein [Bacteroidia bacterium]